MLYICRYLCYIDTISFLLHPSLSVSRYIFYTLLSFGISSAFLFYSSKTAVHNAGYAQILLAVHASEIVAGILLHLLSFLSISLFLCNLLPCMSLLFLLSFLYGCCLSLSGVYISQDTVSRFLPHQMAFYNSTLSLFYSSRPLVPEAGIGFGISLHSHEIPASHPSRAVLILPDTSRETDGRVLWLG